MELRDSLEEIMSDLRGIKKSLSDEFECVALLIKELTGDGDLKRALILLDSIESAVRRLRFDTAASKGVNFREVVDIIDRLGDAVPSFDDIYEMVGILLDEMDDIMVADSQEKRDAQTEEALRHISILREMVTGMSETKLADAPAGLEWTHETDGCKGCAVLHNDADKGIWCGLFRSTGRPAGCLEHKMILVRK